MLIDDDQYPEVWYNSKIDHFRSIDCPVFPGHARAKRNDSNLSIEIKRKKMGDFVSTVYSDWLITDKTAELFKKLKLTGYKLRNVNISNKIVPFELWEFIVVGKAKIHSDSGVKELYHCEHCDLFVRGTSCDSKGVIIDESTWDGSDFFSIEEKDTCVLVTEKVKKIFDIHKLTGILLVPCTEYYLDDIFDSNNNEWSKEQWKEFYESP